MVIAVCVKEVLYTGVPFEVNTEAGVAVQKEPDPVYSLNLADRCALEEAVRIKRTAGFDEVVAITVGPPRASESLYRCLAMGADRAIHVVDEEPQNTDARLTVMALSSVLKSLCCDLILCGSRSSDEGSCQVPQGIAESLDLPQVTGVVSIGVQPGEGRVTAMRRLERGNREVIECPLPAVIAVEPTLNKPPYISLHSYHTASRKRSHDYQLDRDTAGAMRKEHLQNRVTKVIPPQPPAKRVATPDTKSSASDRLKFILTGGVAEKKSSLLEGATGQVVGQLMDLLQREGFLPGESQS